jgi:hypothetical protein
LLGTVLMGTVEACSGTTASPTPTPIVEQSPNNTATPTPEITPTQTPDATPTETATPTPTVEPTPTKGPEVTLTPTQETENDKVFKALEQWKNQKGNTGVPLNKEWEQFGIKQPLTLSTASQDNAGADNFAPDYFTLDVGTIVLNDGDGVPHFIVPLLGIDGKGNHYYVLANNGAMSRKEVNSVGQHPTRELTGMPDTHSLTTAQLQTVLTKLKGDIFVMSFIYGGEGIPSNPTPGSTLAEYADGKPISQKLADFTVEACKPGVDYHGLLNKYPEIAGIINQTPKQINAKNMPFPGSVTVTKLPSY